MELLLFLLVDPLFVENRDFSNATASFSRESETGESETGQSETGESQTEEDSTRESLAPGRGSEIRAGALQEFKLLNIRNILVIFFLIPFVLVLKIVVRDLACVFGLH